MGYIPKTRDLPSIRELSLLQGINSNTPILDKTTEYIYLYIL
jgi:hypothetical protein